MTSVCLCMIVKDEAPVIRRCVYGAERDAAVARAKVVLNVHYYEAATFEAVRVCPLLARGACVISEGEADDTDTADIADGLVLAPLAEIVDRCCSLVAADDERVSFSCRARAAIAARSQADVLSAFFPDAPHPGAGEPRRRLRHHMASCEVAPDLADFHAPGAHARRQDYDGEANQDRHTHSPRGALAPAGAGCSR